MDEVGPQILLAAAWSTSQTTRSALIRAAGTSRPVDRGQRLGLLLAADGDQGEAGLGRCR